MPEYLQLGAAAAAGVMLTILANAARKAGVHAETQIEHAVGHITEKTELDEVHKTLAAQVARVAGLEKQLNEAHQLKGWQPSVPIESLQSILQDLDLQLSALGDYHLSQTEANELETELNDLDASSVTMDPQVEKAHEARVAGLEKQLNKAQADV